MIKREKKVFRKTKWPREKNANDKNNNNRSIRRRKSVHLMEIGCVWIVVMIIVLMVKLEKNN